MGERVAGDAEEFLRRVDQVPTWFFTENPEIQSYLQSHVPKLLAAAKDLAEHAEDPAIRQQATELLCSVLEANPVLQAHVTLQETSAVNIRHETKEEKTRMR